jgi:cytosine permease
MLLWPEIVLYEWHWKGYCGTSIGGVFMNEKNTGFEIKAEQRQSWISIAMVWAGGMICVPCLMVGGVLSGGGLSLPQIIISILIGYGMICAYMIFIGMQACDTGLPVAVMAEGALGKQGARYIISLLLVIACIGWFGIQSATCGTAFASMLASILGMSAPSGAMTAACSIVWGAIMLITACAGFKGLKWLNYVAVPLLVIVCLYGIIAGIISHNGGAAIAAYAPEQSAGLVFGISMTVASFALGGVISADYCRFAKSRSDVVKSSIAGVIPAGLFMLLTGAVMSIVTGQYDISAILASLGVPVIGLIALVLATWTTNVTNAYSGGLALSNLLGFDESKFTITTGIAGAIGTLLVAFGLLNAFQGFLSLMSALIPPLAGVVIADYWVVCKGNKENFKQNSGFSFPGVAAFTIGALAACITGGTFASFPGLVETVPFLNLPFFVGPVNGIVLSLAVYIILKKSNKNQ